MNNEIYSLSGLQKTETGIIVTVHYDATHPVFEGHFPQNPIVPGVCTLNMISDLVRENAGSGLQIRGASNVKFLQLIRPEDSPSVKLNWKESETGLVVTAILEQNGTVMMRFAGTYA